MGGLSEDPLAFGFEIRVPKPGGGEHVSIVTATDFAHPEGRRYQVAVQEILEIPDVSLESKKKMMWDNALRLYPIRL